MADAPLQRPAYLLCSPGSIPFELKAPGNDARLGLMGLVAEVKLLWPVRLGMAGIVEDIMLPVPEDIVLMETEEAVELW